MHQVGFGRKQEVFSMKEIHAEPPFLCDYVRNGYCKREIISTVESKRVFFFVCFFKSQTAHWKWRLTSNVVSALNWSGVYIYIYIYIYNSLNTLSDGKSCLVASGVAVPPWATEIVLSPLVGGWWGQGIARAFTRCMMKKKISMERVFVYIIWILLKWGNFLGKLVAFLCEHVRVFSLNNV